MFDFVAMKENGVTGFEMPQLALLEGPLIIWCFIAMPLT